jgi:metal-responsive CopG/Arc/MetJ family transcriptional regulator
MPTKKPQILLTVDDELLERIDDYRYTNRIPSRSEAVRRLLAGSLDRWEKKPSK